MMIANSTRENVCSDGPLLYILIGCFSFIVLVFVALGAVWLRKYRSLVRSVEDLRRNRSLLCGASHHDTPVTFLSLKEEEEEEILAQTLLQQSSTVHSSSRRLWRGLQQDPHFTTSDLNLLQLIKAGKEGVFYQARMTRGTCKGHSMFTCKISKEGVRAKHVDMEVSIMKKLMHHKNVLQLLDWNTTQEPYILIMEYVSLGTLRTFLQTNRVQLSSDSELQNLLTVASYHIALAMQHLRSKM
ncbi:hypothetical protein LDENG_00172480, partial [Lucifuga dentata]